MHKFTNFISKGNELIFTATFLSILVLMVTSPAAASVNSWELSPQEPVCGDTISVKGNASPEEKVDVYVTFEKTVPVSDGKFEYTLEDVKIPAGLDNFFTVEARGAKDLNVRVKMIVWITKSSEASGETATVSQSNVPPGTYIIKIDGNANEGMSNVNLKITAYQGIEANSKGNFSYSYNTKAVPAGDFEIKAGSIMKKVTIQPERNSDLNSDSSSSSPSSGISSSISPSSEISSSISPSSERTKFSPSEGNKSSSLSETDPSSELAVSKSPEEKNDSSVLTSDKDVQERNIQAQPLEKSDLRSELLRLFVDRFYLLIGVGAVILILIKYLKKN